MSSNEVTSASRFEIGKKYKRKETIGIWVCKAAYGDCAIMEREGDKHIEFASMPEYWEEIKPLTFADLKPGEKFKYLSVLSRMDRVCMKIRANPNTSIHIHSMRNRDEYWTYLEGPYAGDVFAETDAEVIRVD